MDARYLQSVSPLRVMSLYQQLLPQPEQSATVFSSPAPLYLLGIARYYVSSPNTLPCTAGHVFTTVLYGNNELLLPELSSCAASTIVVRPVLTAQPDFTALVAMLRQVLNQVRVQIPCAVRDEVDAFFFRLGCRQHSAAQASSLAA